VKLPRVIDNRRNYQPQKTFDEKKQKGGDAEAFRPFHGGAFSFLRLFAHNFLTA
jgi:hypothetical protein